MKVAVLAGGPSAEAEVSRRSGAEVATALEAAGHKAHTIELDASAAANLLSYAPDVVFPALHGPPGEDGTVQGFLEILGVPYVGAGVHGSAVAMDKGLAKGVFERAGLPIAPHLLLNPSSTDPAGQVRTAFGNDVVVKPLAQGSAIGVGLVHDAAALDAAIEVAGALGGYLVEPFVSGLEITVGVLDEHDHEPFALPVTEVRTAEDEWYDFENRYTAGKSEHIIPAELPDATNKELQRIALAAHTALGLRDLSRADFIVNDESIVLLEVNTLPGMTPTSLYPDGARAAGIPFPELTDRLVSSAQRRG